MKVAVVVLMKWCWWCCCNPSRLPAAILTATTEMQVSNVVVQSPERRLMLYYTLWPIDKCTMRERVHWCPDWCCVRKCVYINKEYKPTGRFNLVSKSVWGEVFILKSGCKGLQASAPALTLCTSKSYNYYNHQLSTIWVERRGGKYIGRGNNNKQHFAGGVNK